MDEELEKLKKELAASNKRHQIELFFAGNKVKSMKAAMAMFDMDSLEEDEAGNYIDLEASAGKFIEENKWLFEQEGKALSTAMPHGKAEVKTPETMTDEEYYRTFLNLK